ncbi:MAG TPA: hypothetical protein VEI97_06850, partial [bacterium]|nr:hypothetical protein [bacterium]
MPKKKRPSYTEFANQLWPTPPAPPARPSYGSLADQMGELPETGLPLLPSVAVPAPVPPAPLLPGGEMAGGPGAGGPALLALQRELDTLLAPYTEFAKGAQETGTFLYNQINEPAKLATKALMEQGVGGVPEAFARLSAPANPLSMADQVTALAQAPAAQRQQQGLETVIGAVGLPPQTVEAAKGGEWARLAGQAAVALPTAFLPFHLGPKLDVSPGPQIGVKAPTPAAPPPAPAPLPGLDALSPKLRNEFFPVEGPDARAPLPDSMSPIVDKIAKEGGRVGRPSVAMQEVLASHGEVSPGPREIVAPEGSQGPSRGLLGDESGATPLFGGPNPVWYSRLERALPTWPESA